jgi:HAE1 family hydrophobic/amphiphilic exporter-1
VSDTIEERTSYSRLNGSDTIVIAVNKSRDGNAVEIAHAADALIEQIQKEYAAEGLTVVKTFEQAEIISDGLKDLNFDLTFAVILVASIVFLFLHDLRGTIIVAIAIPTSIFATFISLNLFGFTINNMTMLALTLAVGVLVDDAIVVLENIYRHLKMGEDPREAAINGRGEIGLAAMAITLADVVVFLPIATMGGIVGQFFKPMAIGFVSAVLVSLFVSFTVTPMLASRWYRAGEDMEHPKTRFARAFERGFARLEHAYRRALDWALHHRWFVFLAGNATLFAIFMFIGGSFAPKPAAAIQTAAPLFMVAVFIGLVVIAIQQVRRHSWRVAGPIIAASLVGGFLLSKVLPVPVPFFALAILLFAVIGFVMNLARPVAKTRMLANAAAFGLIFPIAALAGWAFGQWKQEAVFKFEFIPQSDNGQVNANIELPPGASLAATERVVKQVEGVIGKDPDVKYVVSSLGSQGFGGFGGGGNSGSNYAQVSATLWDKRSLKDKLLRNPERLRDRSDTSVAADLTRQIGRIPGANITVSAAGGGFGGSPIQMSFASSDRRLLLQTVNKINQGLKEGAIKGVINPDISSKPGKIELQVVPDRQLLADKGLNVTTAASAIRTMYQGDDQTKLRVKGKEYVVRVMLDMEDRNDPATLATVPVTFNQGEPVYVGSIAKIQQQPGVTKIDRRQREEEIRLSADLLPGFAPGTVQREIDQWIQKEHLVPEGVVIKPLGQADAQAREQGYLFGAIGIGLVLVYMLLASLYDNLLYPFIIQLAQPQAMVGAILALVITNKSLNIVGMIGIITLVGLVGKNAILLVDYTNTLRSRGRNRHDAIIEAGPTRLRPIMMTTLALILGTMPIALALGRGSEFRETLGITIIGGITLSTLLTLLVIPCSYTIFDDLSNFISTKMHRRRNGAGLEPGSDAESESIATPTQV